MSVTTPSKMGASACISGRQAASALLGYSPSQIAVLAKACDYGTNGKGKNGGRLVEATAVRLADPSFVAGNTLQQDVFLQQSNGPQQIS
jgi:hypothetical protein